MHIVLKLITNFSLIMLGDTLKCAPNVVRLIELTIYHQGISPSAKKT